MDLLAYFRILRRRWILILAFVIAGGTIGASTTFVTGGAASSGKHSKATHTLVFQPTGDSSSSSSSSGGGGGAANPAFSNLEQVAILVTTGDVPTQAAKKLGMEPHQVTERITTETNSTSNTLSITG